MDSARQLDAPRETLKVTRAGFEPSEVMEVAVKPTGLFSGSTVVITAMPEACLLKAALRASLALVFRSLFNITPRLAEGSAKANQIDLLHTPSHAQGKKQMAVLRQIDLRGQKPSEAEIGELLPRAVFDISQAGLAVEPIIQRVKNEGVSAIRELAISLDGVDPDPIKVSKAELDKALAELDPAIRSAIELAISRVRSVSEAAMPKNSSTRINSGAVVSQRFVPVDSVGLYAPGGKAVYPSSVVMNVVPAQVANVKSIFLASPGQKEFSGRVHPTVLATAALLGIENVYCLGGASAVAAFAYGVPDIGLPAVRLITGPGNIYVAAAKRLVRGDVAIDSEAGTTEILIIADESANPIFVAADLISQAEHDEAAAAVLVTNSEDLIEKVQQQILLQLESIKHQVRVSTALGGQQSAAVLVDSIDQAIDVANFYATEHLSIMTLDNDYVAKRISNAGAIFLGEYSPVSLGDYMAGSNHVLPTGGSAKFSSGLGVHTFLRVQQLVEYSAEALSEVKDILPIFAQAEDLPAHGQAVSRRFEGN